MIFFAHSTAQTDQADWHLLADHLRAVGELASQKASAFDAETLARVAGVLHDLGKYSAAFQRRLKGSAESVDHSSWGARIAIERFGHVGNLLAYGIAGHHAGLANGDGLDGERRALRQRLCADLPNLDATWQQEISLPTAMNVPQSFRPHSADRGSFQLAFLTRMLFSCLVDADFLDTEAFFDRIEGRPALRNLNPPRLETLRIALERYLSGLPTAGHVNAIRGKILAHVRGRASLAPGLFSLTVPTGGGKTLATLAFGLDHAIRHGLRRVIFVIPFTSIVEQNAAVFRRAFGDLGAAAVLEHHSAFFEAPAPAADPEHYQSAQKLRLAMENWEAPIIVTSAVQFFESLFADRPSSCRKLHNVAGSVVIVDETQTLPLKVLRPCVSALDELARNYRCSVVLCTATQPVLEAPRFVGGLEQVRELAPEPSRLFQQLRRVRVRSIGALDDDAVAQHLLNSEQLLCIVNNRRHARALYRRIADAPGAVHLSTLMCAKHRSSVLAALRERLHSGTPCRVVSTSLIEAGVDVDFPVVLRAEAGLDAIAQAAGRCNREGRHSVEASDVLIFATTHSEWAPPPELRQFAEAAREVLRHHSDDPLAPPAIEQYFQLLYWKKGERALDHHNLMGLLQASRVESLPLETLAKKFKMIENTQLPVIVPFDSQARQALRDLRFADRVGAIARRLQPYLVQLPRQGYDALNQAGAILPVAPERFGEQFMCLTNENLYTADVGLDWSDPTFVHAESLVF